MTDGVLDKIRQYGAVGIARRLASRLFRPVHSVEEFIVFAIPGFRGVPPLETDIIPFDRKALNDAVERGDLSDSESRDIEGFLADGTMGLMLRCGGRLAGSAWVQTSGIYCYGQAGRMIIPRGFVIMKNLAVRPMFRGRSYGQRLNLARLSLVAPGVTPAVMIIPENRVAIRNWEKFGFRRVLFIRRRRWFHGPWSMTVLRLAGGAETVLLEAAIREGGGG